MAGFQAATGDIVVMLDADGSMDPGEMSSYVFALLAGADYVKGSRFMHGAGTLDMEWYRRLGNWGLNMAVRMTFGGKYSDLCYGYNAFWRDVTPVFLGEVPGFEVETYMNCRALAARTPVAEVASVEAERIRGVSNLRTVRDGFRVLITIWRQWRQHRHGWNGPTPRVIRERSDQQLQATADSLVSTLGLTMRSTERFLMSLWAVVSVVIAGWSGVRPLLWIVPVLFLLLAPGMVLARLVSPDASYHRWAISIASSLAVLALVSTAVAVAGRFGPFVVTALVGMLSIAGLNLVQEPSQRVPVLPRRPVVHGPASAPVVRFHRRRPLREDAPAPAPAPAPAATPAASSGTAVLARPMRCRSFAPATSSSPRANLPAGLADEPVARPAAAWPIPVLPHAHGSTIEAVDVRGAAGGQLVLERPEPTWGLTDLVTSPSLGRVVARRPGLD
ncbi:MAG: glycosyltransferase family 2 protein [Ilumatobacteraceae bacterium]